jgi:hypothetical protein
VSMGERWLAARSCVRRHAGSSRARGGTGMSCARGGAGPSCERGVCGGAWFGYTGSVGPWLAGQGDRPTGPSP